MNEISSTTQSSFNTIQKIERYATDSVSMYLKLKYLSPIFFFLTIFLVCLKSIERL